MTVDSQPMAVGQCPRAIPSGVGAGEGSSRGAGGEDPTAKSVHEVHRHAIGPFQTRKLSALTIPLLQAQPSSPLPWSLFVPPHHWPAPLQAKDGRMTRNPLVSRIPLTVVPQAPRPPRSAAVMIYDHAPTLARVYHKSGFILTSPHGVMMKAAANGAASGPAAADDQTVCSPRGGGPGTGAGTEPSQPAADAPIVERVQHALRATLKTPVDFIGIDREAGEAEDWRVLYDGTGAPHTNPPVAVTFWDMAERKNLWLLLSGGGYAPHPLCCPGAPTRALRARRGVHFALTL